MPKPKYHILVCTNSRPPGHPKPSCGSAGAGQLLMAFNMGLMQRAVPPGQVLVSATGCLGPCEQGPTVVVYPHHGPAAPPVFAGNDDDIIAFF